MTLPLEPSRQAHGKDRLAVVFPEIGLSSQKDIHDDFVLPRHFQKKKAAMARVAVSAAPQCR